MKATKKIINWLISLFVTRYQIRVSFNKEYGDEDDKVYISKKGYQNRVGEAKHRKVFRPNKVIKKKPPHYSTKKTCQNINQRGKKIIF